jgi:hypothetical protein
MLGVMTYQRARIHALLGNRDITLGLLRTALQQGVPDFLALHTDLAFAPLREDGAFQELLRPKG